MNLVTESIQSPAMPVPDHILNAEPLDATGEQYLAKNRDGLLSVVTVFAGRDRAAFDEWASRLRDLALYDGAAIQKVISWGAADTPGHFYIEREWVDGTALSERMSREKLSLDEIESIAEQTARVLALAEGSGIYHECLKAKSLTWDARLERYFVTGFSFSEPRSGLAHSSVAYSDGARKELHDYGSILMELLSARFNIETGRKDLSAAPIELEKRDGISSWMIELLSRCLASSPQGFETAGALYDFILLHHKTQLHKNRWQRSAPQVTTATVKTELQSEIKQPRTKPKRRKRLVVDRYLVGGFIIAAALAFFGIAAQRKETAAARLAQRSATGLADTLTTAATASVTLDSNTVSKNVSLPKPAKAVVSRPKKPVANDAAITTADAQGLTAYKVRSRAYFHNKPDASTRRNAFIVHWNNAILHPQREEGDFVYIVFTNVEGQTSKGWLNKKDLVVVEN